MKRGNFNDIFFVKKPPVDREPNDPYRAPKHISASFTMPTKVRGRVEPQPHLIEMKPDFSLLRGEKPYCPFHFNRVYWDFRRTKLICKKFKHVFTLDVISGKRLLEFRDHVKMMGR